MSYIMQILNIDTLVLLQLHRAQSEHRRMIERAQLSDCLHERKALYALAGFDCDRHGHPTGTVTMPLRSKTKAAAAKRKVRGY